MIWTHLIQHGGNSFAQIEKKAFKWGFCKFQKEYIFQCLWIFWQDILASYLTDF